MTVTVRYEGGEDVWNTVVVAARDNEDPDVIDNRGATFVVEYPSQEHFDNAIARFEGMIEYHVLPKE